jgi:hypothetical protein
MLRPGHHHAIHQDAGNFDLARVQAAALGQAFDLDDDHTAGIPGGHGDGQGFQGQGFPLHGDVTVGIGGGTAHDGDVDGEGFVEQVLLAVDFHDAHQILGGAVVDLAAAESRVDEGAQPHPRQVAGLVRGDIAEQMGDHTLRQVIGVDPAIDGQLLKLGHQPPMAADDLAHKALVAEMVQSPFLAVALAGGIDQGEVAGRFGLQEALFQRHGDAFGKADADEAAGGDGIAVTDQLDGFLGGDDLAPRLIAVGTEKRMSDKRHCAILPTARVAPPGPCQIRRGDDTRQSPRMQPTSR